MSLYCSACNTKNAIKIREFNQSNKKIALILGSEGHGINLELLGEAAHVIKIPVNNFVEHLNVSNAAAIFFHHFQN